MTPPLRPYARALGAFDPLRAIEPVAQVSWSPDPRLAAIHAKPTWSPEDRAYVELREREQGEIEERESSLTTGEGA